MRLCNGAGMRKQAYFGGGGLGSGGGGGVLLQISDPLSCILHCVGLTTAIVLHVRVMEGR